MFVECYVPTTKNQTPFLYIIIIINIMYILKLMYFVYEKMLILFRVVCSENVDDVNSYWGGVYD